MKRSATRSTGRALVELIGNVKLVELKIRDVDFTLGKLAERPSTRSVRLARMILIQASRNAMVNDAAGGERLWSYVAVSMLGTVAVCRSDGAPGRPGPGSPGRVFQIPEIAVAALRELVLKQAADRANAGTARKEN